jgi:hypothetical protein
VIRNVVVHMNNEQPLMADLRALPTAADACLMCTNLRQMGGKKPTFTDALDSWFLIPLGQIRFVEVSQASIDDSDLNGVLALPSGPILERDAPVPMDEPMDVESGNELLRRMREV